MSTETLNVSILNRNDTKTNWESTNPKLYNGEIGIDTTSKDFKIGDNTNNWKGLPYYLYGKPTNIRFYIKGTGSTARSLTSGGSPYNRAIVRGTITEPISNLTSGMMVSIKLDISTSNACGTILELKDSSNNILLDSKDSTTSSTKGQHPIVYNVNSKLEDRYTANSIINLIYDEDQTASVYINGTNTSIRGCWKIFEYMLNRSSINNIGLNESYLIWGGKNFSGSYGPIDSSMVSDLSADRFAFLPTSCWSIEYSRDGGTTWADYGATDSQKLQLTSTGASNLRIGKCSTTEKATAQYQIRFTLTTNNKVYSALNKFIIYVSTDGSNNNWCTITARTKANLDAGNDTWVTYSSKTSVSGWSGWNVINTSSITTWGNSSNQYGQLRFTFGCDTATNTTKSTYSGMQIQKIKAFGGVGWVTPSNMAKYNHLYQYDYNQNAVFPAIVRATSFNENGTLLSNKYVSYTSNTVSVAGTSKSVATITPNALYVSNGLIMGGNAAQAGLATRGICGVSTPSSTGACTKENLYLNYDGNNTYSRSIVLGADASGNAITTKTAVSTTATNKYGNLFSAIRGDQMVNYVRDYLTDNVTSVTASKATASTARSIGNANVGTAISVVTGVGSTKFVTGIAGGSGDLVSEDEVDSSKTQIKYIDSIASTELTLTKTTDTFLKDINGGSGSLTSNTTSTTGDISYLSDVTYTSASSSGGGTVGIDNGRVTLTGTYTSSNQKLVLNLNYTAQKLTGTTTFITGITPGSISKTIKYLHHTHTGASSKTTGSALTNVTKSGGTITPTIKYLYHTHKAASVSNQATVTSTTTNITPAVKSTDTITPYTFTDVTASKIN